MQIGDGSFLIALEHQLTQYYLDYSSTGAPKIMNDILTQEHLDKGLSTVIHFDYIYLLDPREVPINRWYSTIDRSVIRAEADKYLSQNA